MKKNVTIYDIANEAGVSPSTVSRVLTGKERVKPDTKSKVLSVIEKYNFRPNSLARSLLYKQSKMIGIVLPDINHPFFSTLVLKSEAHALSLGYTSFLCNSMDDHQIESKYLQNLVDKQVDGIIFLGGRINQVETSKELAEEMNKIRERVPVVFVNGEMEGVDAHIVQTDEHDGITKVIDLLKNFNHQKIAFLGGEMGISSREVKLRAYTEAMEKNHLSINPNWVMDEGFDIESGEELANRLLYQSERPTAIVCVNDFVAIGVIKTLDKFGLRVPEDISVVGFDDIYLAKDYPPGITSVSQNYEVLGRTAVDVLVKLINGEEAEKQVIVPTKLMLRNSCQLLKK
ncbi:LacI family DNA-binding transcriptional regulator [Gracilibacillus salitolerans]|uniref:LacI family DNA-binding transcriptional regulator n=1 Tax=Gracilibacillus salitolerans TaxID=2663022 RepID=A0A5Q2TKT5_9BACI|nr:LacI family DNA-binding transcriptional regulator [Gracilibacillus salitolerans]QGH33898.1 LacI family DNA-binding transcriptional regulator [Gracilibacillus salitolerans]